LRAIGKNVTVDTHEMDVPLHGAAAATCRMQTCGCADRQQVERGPKLADHLSADVSASKHTIRVCQAKVKFKVSVWTLEVGRIIGNCHFYIVLMGTLGVTIFS